MIKKLTAKDIKGTYFYFEDLVDNKSMNYGKIALIKSRNIEKAWEELLSKHHKEYNENSNMEDIKSLYRFIEKREI
ncbi:hypothetical protein [Clostridium botulinum]|uniref:hypothetical protein n=1 Tax=Clostridium botulinum TaxID=1491 RepID=UPI001C9AC1DC|nr:hypothetical protein [Clostridium botulinum]MBY6838704.1 hypothetical protein [Clostridium botulinum]